MIIFSVINRCISINTDSRHFSCITLHHMVNFTFETRELLFLLSSTHRDWLFVYRFSISSQMSIYNDFSYNLLLFFMRTNILIDCLFVYTVHCTGTLMLVDYFDDNLLSQLFSLFLLFSLRDFFFDSPKWKQKSFSDSILERRDQEDNQLAGNSQNKKKFRFVITVFEYP